MAYRIAGAGDGNARLASFAIGHEQATAEGGTLSLELRRTAVWESEQRLDITSARLGWQIKF
ncbi:MAG: hypothetical protein PSV46_09175 [Reyranella sp.]|nr:hypothetical protein [Reyranella sp.]